MIMNIDTVRTVIMWCTIINGAWLLLAVLLFACAGDWVYRMHTRWFALPRETFNVIIYCFLGSFKLVFLMFNLVPYVALVIIE